MRNMRTVPKSPEPVLGLHLKPVGHGDVDERPQKRRQAGDEDER